MTEITTTATEIQANALNALVRAAESYAMVAAKIEKRASEVQRSLTGGLRPMGFHSQDLIEAATAEQTWKTTLEMARVTGATPDQVTAAASDVKALLWFSAKASS